MCRKMGVSVIAVMLSLGALWTLGAITLGAGKTNSLIGCGWNKFQHGANNQVPVEVEIERIKHEIAQLMNDQTRNINLIGEETVAVRKLNGEITHIRANLDTQKGKLLAASKQLEDGYEYVRWEDREFKASVAEQKLARELAIYKKNAAELKAKEDLLAARQQALGAAKEQLSTIKDQKRELEVRVAQLEAEYKTLQVQQSRSKFQFNNERLTSIKKSLEELDTRIQTEAETLKLYEDFSTEGRPVVETSKTSKVSKNVAQEIREFFGETDTVNGKTVVGKE